MITYKQVDETYFNEYDSIPMRVRVASIYELSKISRGLGGFSLTKVDVKPYMKDFCTGKDESISRWIKSFDTRNWAFFMAFDVDKPIGAATVASRTKEINMLAGRSDLAVLWDIRVHDDYKGQGIGQALFDMAKTWAKAQGLVQMKIECQNNNVPAVNFYHKQGAVLGGFDEYAYYEEPEYRDEVQLLWYLDL